MELYPCDFPPRLRPTRFALLLSSESLTADGHVNKKIKKKEKGGVEDEGFREETAGRRVG